MIVCLTVQSNGIDSCFVKIVWTLKLLKKLLVTIDFVKERAKLTFVPERSTMKYNGQLLSFLLPLDNAGTDRG